jgi:hypothetical protein
LFDYIEPVINYETINKICPIKPENYRSDKDSKSYTKYIRDFEENYERALATFAYLYAYENLFHKSDISFLDIGTGFGLLPYIFSKNFDKIFTIDMEGKPEYFDVVLKILGIRQEAYTIKKYEFLPKFDLKFDLINASQICFNGHKTKDLWDVNEWKFFLFDIHDNFLNKDGAIYLSFNYEDGPINLGKESVENLFAPYIDRHKFPNWKVAKLNKDDIGKLKK